MIYLIGAGGHAKVIIELLEDRGVEIGGLIANSSDRTVLFNYPIINSFPPHFDRGAVSTIIAVGNNTLRKRISFEYEDFQLSPAVFHSRCNMSPRADIGHGSVLMAGVTVNCDVVIGKHCIINTNSSIDHDCSLSDFVHISPNGALAGNVTVGEGSHIGIGASVLQGVNIGKWATIGAGAVITRDVPDYAVVVGVPGKIIKYNTQHEG
ncbi:acetyltransferase [Daejeonella sp. JGW-45]|uniref:acetyltransferase n=1 Tax=Daejeonella sp. JGW-45 TaxID=3034148 RepID=UPI0023EE011E|nr:acetyltransferase [Daejeonella sp. JGW-45]